eukprot:COSAG02_NODE_966_length_15587_cov_19.602376_14_plen_102_part_00
MDPTLGSGHYKYAEFQYICTPEQISAKNCFGHVDHIELFDLAADPYAPLSSLQSKWFIIYCAHNVCRYELHNVYSSATLALRRELAKRLRRWYPCMGVGCP